MLVEGHVVREGVGEDRGVGRDVVADAAGVDDGAEGREALEEIVLVLHPHALHRAFRHALVLQLQPHLRVARSAGVRWNVGR